MSDPRLLLLFLAAVCAGTGALWALEDYPTISMLLAYLCGQWATTFDFIRTPSTGEEQ